MGGMTTDIEETIIRQILFRHRTQVKGGKPNSMAETKAIRFAISERRNILRELEERTKAEQLAASRPSGSRTQRGRRDHRPTSDGLPREDER